jgi:3-deoxy-7-phosphoheptulonate synthase
VRPDARQHQAHQVRVQDPGRVRDLRGFFAAHRECGTHPGGVHLELAGEHVTECVGGCVNPVAEDKVPHAYQSACDPRLSPAQALECAAVVTAGLTR